MMDSRLTQLPDPELEARVDGLVHGWCGVARDLCRCDPQPLPDPAPSSRVRALQRGAKAENALEAEIRRLGPTTPESARTAASDHLGSISGLFPPKRGAA